MTAAQLLGLGLLAAFVGLAAYLRATSPPVDQDALYARRVVRRVLRLGEHHDDLVNAWRDSEGLHLESELGPIRLIEPQLVAVVAARHRQARLLAQADCSERAS